MFSNTFGSRLDLLELSLKQNTDIEFKRHKNGFEFRQGNKRYYLLYLNNSWTLLTELGPDVTLATSGLQLSDKGYLLVWDYDSLDRDLKESSSDKLYYRKKFFARSLVVNYLCIHTNIDNVEKVITDLDLISKKFYELKKKYCKPIRYTGRAEA